MSIIGFALPTYTHLAVPPELFWERCRLAAEMYPMAHDAALETGRLKLCFGDLPDPVIPGALPSLNSPPTVYRLWHEEYGLLWRLYPGNCRIRRGVRCKYIDFSRSLLRCSRITGLPKIWTMLDVIEHAKYAGITFCCERKPRGGGAVVSGSHG